MQDKFESASCQLCDKLPQTSGRILYDVSLHVIIQNSVIGKWQ